jgi:hypothetical protein
VSRNILGYRRVLQLGRPFFRLLARYVLYCPIYPGALRVNVALTPTVYYDISCYMYMGRLHCWCLPRRVRP